MLMEASGTDAEQQLFERLSGQYRIVRVPSLDDPLWQPGYLDALPFFEAHGEGTTNIGFIPRL